MAKRSGLLEEMARVAAEDGSSQPTNPENSGATAQGTAGGAVSPGASGAAENMTSAGGAPPFALAPDEPEDDEQNAARPAQATPAWLEGMRAAGFSDVNDPDASAARLLAAYQQSEQQRRAAEEAAAEAATLKKIIAQLAHGQVAPTAQQPEPPQSQPRQNSWWSPPEVDLTLLQAYRVQDDKGNLSWRPETPPAVIQAAEQYRDYVSDWQQRIATQPHTVLPKIVEEIVAPLIEQRVREILDTTDRSRREEAYIDTVRRENPWLFEVDPRTNQPARGRQGELVYSDRGRRIMEIISELEQNGVRDFQRQWDLASKLERAESLVAQQQAAPTTQQQQQDRRMEALLSGGGSIPDRQGSFPNRAQQNNPRRQPQNSRMSSGMALIEGLRQQGAFAQ